MPIKVAPAERLPLTELDHVARVPMPIELARMLVPDMGMVRGGSAGEIVWVGKMWDYTEEEDLDYPSNPIDLYVSDGKCFAITTALFGAPTLGAWIRERLMEPMIVAIPKIC